MTLSILVSYDVSTSIYKGYLPIEYVYKLTLYCSLSISKTTPAARMESTGSKNRIQCSQATADLLIAAGKKHWVKAREDAVEAKGKGVLNTFWLHPMSKNDSSNASSDNDGTLVSLDGSADNTRLSGGDAKQDRLVDWMVEILLFDIRKIVRTEFVCRCFHHVSLLQRGVFANRFSLDCLSDFTS